MGDGMAAMERHREGMETGGDIFAWESRFETGIEEIDDQHRRLLQLINRLGGILMLESDADAFAESLFAVFGELTDYARYHFSFEENLMDEFHFDPVQESAHKKAHEAFNIRMQEARIKAGTHPVEVAGKTLTFLSKWLMTHIVGIDMVMAKKVLAIRSGLSEEDAERQARNFMRTDALLYAVNRVYDGLAERTQQLLVLKRSLDHEIGMRKKMQEELARQARTDALTGLSNRRHFIEMAEQELVRAGRYGKALSILMFDLDEFKAINDTHGHHAGDCVLQKIAEICSQTLRDGVDIAGRMGGEEFAVLLPQTDAGQACEIAERLRRHIADAVISDGQGETLRVTASIGIATLSSETSVDNLLSRADKAMYEAKRAGRDKVCAM